MKYIFLILSIFAGNFLQAQTMRSVYDLDFQGFDKCNWDWNQGRKACMLDLTSAGVRVYPPKISSQKMEFKFGKEIIFPISKIQNLEIKLFANSTPYSPLKFKLIGIDKNENIAFVKATIFQKGDSVKGIRVDSKLEDLKCVNVLIKGECEKGKLSEFVLKKVEVWLNNKNYTDEPMVERELSGIALSKDYIQPLYPLNPKYWNRNGKGGKFVKIIGLGENTHGSKTIAETKLAFIKDLVIHDNCTLILTEYPSDIALLFDLFVQGISNDKELVEDYLKFSYDHTSKLSFLIWLKEYNSQSDKKVHLVGIDNPNLVKYALMDFYSMVMDSTEAKPYLDKIYKRDFKELLRDTKENNQLKSKLGKESFQHFSHVLNEFSQRPTYIHEERDSLMFIRLSFAKKTFAKRNEKIAILAHSAHLQKIEMLFFDSTVSPLGAFLAKKYKKDYVAINFNFGSGPYVQDSCSLSFKRIIDSLKYLPENSFEAAAMKAEVDQFIYPTEYLPESIQTTAMIPRMGQNRNHFKYTAIKNRFDYIVFSRKSEAFENIIRDSFMDTILFSRKKDKQFKIGH